MTYAAVAISETSKLHIEPEGSDMLLCGRIAPISNSRGDYVGLNHKDWMWLRLDSATSGVCKTCLYIYQTRSETAVTQYSSIRTTERYLGLDQVDLANPVVVEYGD